MKKPALIICIFILPFIGFAQADVREGRKGNVAYNNGEFEQAEINYRKALEAAGQDIRHRYNLAGSLYKQEKYEEAAKLYQEVGEISQDKMVKAAAYHNLGNSLLASDKLKESIEAYEQSLRNNPSDLETKYNLSYAKKLLKEQEQQKQQEQQEQEQEQEQQQQQQGQEQQQRQGQEQESKGMSSKEAEQMLKALENDEKNTLNKVKQQQKVVVPKKIEKDW